MLWRKIKFYTVSGIILVLAAATTYLYYFGGRGVGVIHRRVDPPAVVREIQKLSELVSVKYGVQKVIGLEEEKVPFGSEKLLLLVRAEVLAGVNLASLTTNDVSVTSDGRVRLRLPSPTVLHVYVSEKDTQTWDRKVTWWTPWVGYNPDLEKKARLAALEAVQAAALEMGILQEAQKNAELAIRNVLTATGAESVEFEAGGVVGVR